MSFAQLDLDKVYNTLSATTSPEAIKAILLELEPMLVTPAQRLAFARHKPLLKKMTTFFTSDSEPEFLSIKAINLFAKITDSESSTSIPEPELQNTLLAPSNPFLSAMIKLIKEQTQNIYHYAILLQRASIILGKLMLENRYQQKRFSEDLAFRHLIKETLKKAAWINNGCALNNTLLMIHFMTYNNNSHIERLMQDQELCTLISDQLHFDDTDVKETTLQLMHTLMGQSARKPRLHFNMFRATHHDGIIKINLLFELLNTGSTLKQKTYATAILLLFFSHHHHPSIPRVIFNPHYLPTLKEILKSKILSSIDSGLYGQVSIFQELDIARSTIPRQAKSKRALLTNANNTFYELQEHIGSDPEIARLILKQLECDNITIKSKTVALIGFLCHNHPKNQALFGPRFIKTITLAKLNIPTEITLKTLIYLLASLKKITTNQRYIYQVERSNQEMAIKNTALMNGIISLIHYSFDHENITNSYGIMHLLTNHNANFVRHILTTNLITHGLTLTRHHNNSQIIAHICALIKNCCSEERQKIDIIKAHPLLFADLHRFIKHPNTNAIYSALKTIKAIITASSDNQGALLTEPNFFKDITQLLSHPHPAIQKEAYKLASSLLTITDDPILKEQVSAFETRPSKTSITLLRLFGSDKTPKEWVATL